MRSYVSYRGEFCPPLMYSCDHNVHIIPLIIQKSMSFAMVGSVWTEFTLISAVIVIRQSLKIRASMTRHRPMVAAHSLLYGHVPRSSCQGVDRIISKSHFFCLANFDYTTAPWAGRATIMCLLTGWPTVNTITWGWEGRNVVHST